MIIKNQSKCETYLQYISIDYMKRKIEQNQKAKNIE